VKREPIKRSRSKFAWLLGVTAVVFALLYRELPGLLYVLSTLAMCALFIVVAFSDLKTSDSGNRWKRGVKWKHSRWQVLTPSSALGDVYPLRHGQSVNGVSISRLTVA
jgi:hypothetical protein